jgi:hypothetical protein
VTSWVLYLDIDSPSQNRLYGNVRNHHAARAHYARIRNDAELQFKRARNVKGIPLATGKRRITWERILGPRQREYDETNFIGGLKPIVDGMVRAELLVELWPGV